MGGEREWGYERQREQEEVGNNEVNCMKREKSLANEQYWRSSVARIALLNSTVSGSSSISIAAGKMQSTVGAANRTRRAVLSAMTT
jgi:hypothetical protein